VRADQLDFRKILDRSTSNIPNVLIVAILPILMKKSDSDGTRGFWPIVVELRKVRFQRLAQKLDPILSRGQALLRRSGAIEPRELPL
jgi:hypothetical protein